MSNLFDTGSETVDRMCRLQFTGNVIPSFDELKYVYGDKTREANSLYASK